MSARAGVDVDWPAILLRANRDWLIGKITRRGALGPELCVPVEPFFRELAKYDMHVTETRTVAIS